MASTTKTVTPNADGKYVCPTCDEEFETQQAYGGHATKHAREQRAGRAVAQFSIKAQVAEQMREVLAPMQAQLDELNAGIATRTRELSEMREARTMIIGVMNKLDPTVSTKAKSNGSPNGAAAVASRSFDLKLAKVREVVEQHPELFEDGTTANALGDHWREQGWQPQVSLVTIRRCFELLRDQGIMRADRVTKGGGMSWKLVGKDNGGDDSGT